MRWELKMCAQGRRAGVGGGENQTGSEPRTACQVEGRVVVVVVASPGQGTGSVGAGSAVDGSRVLKAVEAAASPAS